jgi:hypothetical protein
MNSKNLLIQEASTIFLFVLPLVFITHFSFQFPAAYFIKIYFISVCQALSLLIITILLLNSVKVIVTRYRTSLVANSSTKKSSPN